MCQLLLGTCCQATNRLRYPARMIKGFWYACLLGTVISAGCGDEETGDSGVSASKSLIDLSSAEAESYCLWANEMLPNALTGGFACMEDAIEAGVGECAGVLAACQLTIEPIDEDACQNASPETFPACADSVKIAEMESCVRGFQDLKSRGLAALTCESTEAGLAQYAGLPSSCAGVAIKCPALFE